MTLSFAGMAGGDHTLPLSSSLPVFSMSIVGSTVAGVRAEPTRKLWNASPTIICQP